MKIVYLNYNDYPTNQAAGSNLIGGLNTILFNLINNITQQHGQLVTVVRRNNGLSMGKETWSEVNLTAGPQQTLTRAESEKYLPQFIKSCAEYFSQKCPDIVHTSGSEAGETMRQLRLRGLSIPWVHTNYATLAVRKVIVEGQENTTATTDPIGQREKQVLETCDQIITLSTSDKTEVASIFNIPMEKIDVVEPGIDTDVFYPTFGRRNRTIISAGRMSKIKDFPFLLRSFSILKKRGLNGNLVVIGGNTTERENLGLLDLASALDLTNYLTWIDGVSQIDLANYFRSARVFVACSLHETFGLLPVEARACGTPFVARANSGYLATARDGYGGYFCKSDSEIDLADHIQQVLDLSEIEWQTLSLQAIKSIVPYNWLETARRSLAVYKKTINKQKTK